LVLKYEAPYKERSILRFETTYRGNMEIWKYGTPHTGKAGTEIRNTSYILRYESPHKLKVDSKMRQLVKETNTEIWDTL
jgi:hypothetical protein